MWILSCQRSLRLMWGCTKDLCCHILLCNEVKTIMEFTYLGYRLSAGGGYEAAMTARTRCEWVKFRWCN